jgi:hypothetical protein
MSYVQVPPDGAGKKIHTKTQSVAGNQVETQVLHLADPTNPEYIQQVDIRGQAFTRFAEGSPSLDAFGNLRVSEGTVLGAYEYTNNSMEDLFQDLSANGGSLVWNSGIATSTMAVTGASGSSITRSTNRWHYYQPGVANVITHTLYLGDNGKPGNIRRWGYFGIRNGLLWELNGTSLGVVQRSYFTGAVTNLRVDRENWNGDKLDGTGPSGMILDLTKANYFWIDFAWLGVGVSRFGILAPDGSRWVCHTFENPNNNIGPYMARGSLPLRYENFNTDATSGTSELHLICSAVYAAARTDYTFWRHADIETPTPVTVGATDTHLFTMRPSLETTPGIPNRVGIYPDYLNVFVSGGSVKLTILDDASLTNPTWVSAGDGHAEADYSATLSDGEIFFSIYLPPGAHRVDLAPYYETNDEGYHVLADWTDSYRMSVVAKRLDGTSVTVSCNLGYRELA